MSWNQRKLFVAILVFAFAIRTIFAVYWQRQAQEANALFRLGDSHSYWTLAEQIAQGKPYQYGSEDAQIFRAPLFPLALAPLTKIPDQRTAVLTARILGGAFGTAAIALLMVVASRLGGPCASLCTGGICAIHPGAIGMSTIILSEILFVPLMVAHILAWQSAWYAENQRQRIGNALFAGLLAGLAVLARPSWLLFIPFTLVAGVIVGQARKRQITIFLVSATAVALVMTPWWLRNARITGHFVPTTLQVGPSLYDGLHPGATGASDEGMTFMRDLLEQQIAEDQQSRLPLDSTLEYRLNRRASRAALTWARETPFEVVRLAGKKFLRTWSLWPDGGDVGSPLVRLGITISSFGILVLAIGSLPRLWSQGWFAAICWMPCIYFTLLHMVFVGSIRYREPAVFLLASLAGCFAAHCFGCKVERRYPNRNPSQNLQGSKSVPICSTNDAHC